MQTVTRSKQRGEYRGASHPLLSIHSVFAFCILNLALPGSRYLPAAAADGGICGRARRTGSLSGAALGAADADGAA